MKKIEPDLLYLPLTFFLKIFPQPLVCYGAHVFSLIIMHEIDQIRPHAH